MWRCWLRAAFLFWKVMRAVGQLGNDSRVIQRRHDVAYIEGKTRLCKSSSFYSGWRWRLAYVYPKQRENQWLNYTLIVTATIGEGNGTPLPYSCLENPMDREAWWAAVCGVAKSQTWLSDFTFTFHFHALEKALATHSCSCLENPRDGGAWVGCRLWGGTELDMSEAT